MITAMPSIVVKNLHVAGWHEHFVVFFWSFFFFVRFSFIPYFLIWSLSQPPHRHSEHKLRGLMHECTWSVNNKWRLHQVSCSLMPAPPLLARSILINLMLTKKPSRTSSRAFNTGSVRAPDKKDQWMDWLAVVFNRGTGWHQTRTRCELMLLFSSSKPHYMRRGDAKRWSITVLRIPWLNSTLCEDVCVFIRGEHWCRRVCWAGLGLEAVLRLGKVSGKPRSFNIELMPTYLLQKHIMV